MSLQDINDSLDYQPTQEDLNAYKRHTGVDVPPTIVQADSVADYLRRYYKQNRYKDIESFAPGDLLRNYEYDYEVYGFVHTSHYDNITGEWICWPEYKQITQEQVDRRQTYPDYVKPEPDKDPAAVSLGRRGGLVKSEIKTEKSRANGLKGGRPKRTEIEPDSGLFD